MKIYISGPIANQPNGNREAFDRAARRLSDLGHDPVNPHVVGLKVEAQMSPGADLRDFRHAYMQVDLEALLKCDGIYLLPKWSRSSGAKLEKAVAQATGKAIYYVLSEVPGYEDRDPQKRLDF